MAELMSFPSKLAYTRDQVINEEFRYGLPNELLFADDVAVTYTEEEM